ncbi:MAG: arginine--tRNA ligase, partial [Firmicutes bacterium]|nr:arginine--tRNA ligase [Bacillota bacterium]
LVKESQGALIVDLEAHGLPPCLLRKKDGATLYITRDLAAAIYRHESYSFEKMLYVVGAEQTLHFKQLFKVLELAGLDWSSKCYHIPFGLIRFPDGRMSTREGKTIFLEEVLNRAVKLAREIIEEKNPEHPNKDKAARAVGLGAVIFGDLSNDRIKDIDFDWDKILDFSGETAPYIQYAHARIHSILRKAGFKPGSLPCQDVSGLDSPPEEQLVISLSLLPQQLQRTLAENKPSILARYLIDVAKDFNKFYHNCPVLTAKPPELKEARLLLCDATRQVLATGLNLLGIEAPAEM